MATVSTVSPIEVAREFSYQLSLENGLEYLKSGIPDFSSKFKNGASGTTVKIPRPAKFRAGSGTWDASTNANDVHEGSVNLAMPSTPYTVSVELSDDQAAFSFQDLKQQVIKPMSSALAQEIEYRALAAVCPKIANSVYSSKFDTSAVGELQAHMNEALAPKSDRKGLITSFMANDLARDTEGFFNSQAAISKQNETGVVRRWSDFDFMTSTMLPKQATGSRAASTLTANVTEGSAEFSIDIGSGTETIKAGEVFWVVGRNDVNAQTKADLGFAKKFVVSTDVVATGGVVAKVPATEAVYASSTDARRNIVGLPQSGDTVEWVGGVSATLQQGLLYHPNAFATAFAEIPVVDPAMQAISSVPGTKMKIRYEKYRVGRSGFTGHRFDCLFAIAVAEPAFAARYFKTASKT